MVLVGIIEMKENKGRILFTEDDVVKNGVGVSCEKHFAWDDVAKNLQYTDIGKEIEIDYGKGYSGKAFIKKVSVH